ncbi:GNAT family N-acetyltransferase [Shewanella sp. JM162201]|uniref:GNAT family N-acetyltransferase n=1 Tax=Shewanella jiangmenensis TaxID=2837387 RepID=A0ABS5V5F9_9GAMM|nr:GNAT family N-acetyltransferase [Shewanella jiangmenensis]MBT1445067.1 GNAT family N-acetyltransferase [Shewanella jiangmenensis]
MTITLRTPQSTDYLAIASWFDNTTDVRRWAGPTMPYPFAASELEALLQKPELALESFCLVDDTGTLCGFGQFWRPLAAAGMPAVIDNSVHLGRIVIAPGQRGRGYGRLLMELLIAKAIEVTAASALTLRVYRSNLVAATLYSQLGFVALDQLSNDELLFMALIR